VSTHPPDTGAWASRMMRNTVGLAAWTGAWVASLALAAFGPEAIWNEAAVPTIGAIALSVAIGIGMLFAYKRNLQAQDELQRSTQFQAMGWTLGAGLVGGIAWSLFDRHDIVSFEAEIAHLIVFMSLVFVVGTVVGMLRYR
jgi:hypothetical protein